MMENDETLSKWNGNFYTTATLGFASQIIQMGMEKDADKGVWSALIFDMIADAERSLENEGITDETHPKMQAYRALLSVKDQYE